MHTLTYGKISGIVVEDRTPWDGVGIEVKPGGSFEGALAIENVPTEYANIAPGALDLDHPPEVVAKRGTGEAPDPVGLVQRVEREEGGFIVAYGMILEQGLPVGFHPVTIDVSEPRWE